jgi:hypothetical protein
MLDLSLDHVGVGMRDLDSGRIAFDRLGFRLTARSLHAGSPSAGAPVVPWGSGNHCAMFKHGYLEVLGLTDPNRYSSVKDMVSRYEGLHIVALGCADADATHRALVAGGVSAEPPRALERDAAFGPADGEVRRARFKNIYLDRERYPEARFLCIEHLTREVLWQPHLMHHPNGALALEAVYFCTEDLAATAAKISELVGATPAQRASGHVELALARGTLHVVDVATWSAATGFALRAAPPLPVGFGVRVRSLQSTRAFLAQGAVQWTERDGVWVGPEAACGAALHFY